MTTRLPARPSDPARMLDPPPGRRHPMNSRHTTLATAVAAGAPRGRAHRLHLHRGPRPDHQRHHNHHDDAPTASATPSTSLDPAAKEAQDRQDAEIVWRKFNALTLTIAALTAEQVEPAITEVAVDPQASPSARRVRQAHGPAPSRLRARHLLHLLAPADRRQRHRRAQRLPGRLPGRVPGHQDRQQAHRRHPQHTGTGNPAAHPRRLASRERRSFWKGVTCTPGQWNA